MVRINRIQGKKYVVSVKRLQDILEPLTWKEQNRAGIQGKELKVVFLLDKWCLHQGLKDKEDELSPGERTVCAKPPDTEHTGALQG